MWQLGGLRNQRRSMQPYRVYRIAQSFEVDVSLLAALRASEGRIQFKIATVIQLGPNCGPRFIDHSGCDLYDLK